MIQAIIVEDEAVAARRLQAMLEKEGISIIDSFRSNKALTNYLKQEERPDLFFMDIHLSDGIVFESLQSVELKTPIIFTTAYDEFAIKAFKQNSVDYLLKPIDKAHLQIAIRKFQEIYQSPPAIDLNQLSLLLSPTQKSFRTRISLKIGDRIKSLKMTEVIFIYSENKITFLVTENGRAYPIDPSLDALSKELDPTQFHRVNRQQIVNIDSIEDVITYSNSRLKILVRGYQQAPIIVARDRVKAFRAWLG